MEFSTHETIGVRGVINFLERATWVYRVRTQVSAYSLCIYIFSKINIHSSCEIKDIIGIHIRSYSNRAYYWVCVLINDISRELVAGSTG